MYELLLGPGLLAAILSVVLGSCCLFESYS